MKKHRFLHLVLVFALLVALVPASSHAAVFISVGFAPPVLPVYVQPPCPDPGWMWTPGYWAYGPDGYYWVPGTWVPAPYVGALWTPGYWGWGSGLYVWHPGYWGRHVGYYGGVNYGFGYMGVGFVGGVWAGNAFRYNTAVMHVGGGIHNTYVDRTIVERNTIVNNRHVAFSGGPGGINHPPTREENQFSHEQHMSATSYQVQHRDAAMQNHSSYFNSNHGHPNNAAMARPMGFNAHGSASAGFNANRSNEGNRMAQPANRNNENHMNEGGHFNQTARPNNEFNHGAQPQPHAQPQMREARPAPQQHESRPAPQSHESHGGGDDRGHGRDR
jgi:WXXGXW repeat (2 copies)